MLSACSVGRAIRSWSEDVGTGLPVKDGVERCQGYLSCFGEADENNPPPKIPSPEEAGVKYEYPGGRRRPAESPAGKMDKQQKVPAKIAPKAEPWVEPKTSAAPSVPSSLFYQDINGSNLVEGNALENSRLDQKPDSNKKLNSWEENPEWKKDLPESPIDSLREGLDW